MIDAEQIDRIEGSTAYDVADEKVGRVGELYLDDQSGTPSWVTVTTGLFGTSETFAPLQGASIEDGQDLRLAYGKDTITNAPWHDTDEHLDQAEEERVVVGKETVVVEQVRVGTQEVTEQEVSEPVRRERVGLETEDDVDRPAL